MTAPDPLRGPHGHADPHAGDVSSRLNWLRAGVLGANDGIVSVAALLVGVAAATADGATILIAGIASLIAGAVSMALGEYVSVSSQRDTERALIAKERWELATMPEEELEELTELFEAKGLSRPTAEQVARELTAHDALAAHLETELHMAEDDESSPWQAAGASALAFTIGAAIPLVAALVAPVEARVPLVIASVLLALAFTGWISARLGGARSWVAILRVVAGGALALGATWAIGRLLGASVAG